MMCLEVADHANEVMGDPMRTQRQQRRQAEQDKAGKRMQELPLQVCRVIADLLSDGWEMVHEHCIRTCTHES